MMHAVEPPSVSEKPHGDGPGGRGRASASETGASRRNMRNTRSMTMNVSVIAPWITALLNRVGPRKEEAAHADRDRVEPKLFPVRYRTSKSYLLKCSETSGLINLCIKRDLHSRAYLRIARPCHTDRYGVTPQSGVTAPYPTSLPSIDGRMVTSGDSSCTVSALSPAPG